MATDKNPRPPERRIRLDEPYVRGDVLPAPEAVEMNSDAAWELWKEAHDQHEARFADTAPMPVAPPDAEQGYARTEPSGLMAAGGPAPAAPTGPKVKPPTVDEAMLEARKNNRVCPLPARWQELYRMLPERSNNRPTPPLVGASWQATPSLSKRMCLREHLEWAQAKGCLEPVLSFLRQLPENEWHHMGA